MVPKTVPRKVCAINEVAAKAKKARIILTLMRVLLFTANGPLPVRELVAVRRNIC